MSSNRRGDFAPTVQPSSLNGHLLGEHLSPRLMAGIQDVLRLSNPSSINEGYYFCYFPAQNLDGFLVRSLLRVRICDSSAVFKRVTLFRSRESNSRILAISKHIGIVCSDDDVSYLVGVDANSDASVSLLVVENRAKAGSLVQRGLALVKGFNDHLACQVCLERIPSEFGGLKKMFSALGIVAKEDRTLSPLVRRLFENANASSPNLVNMSNFEGALHL